MEHSMTRQLLAKVESEIAKVRKVDPVTTVAIDWTPLQTAFSELSSHLALGPEPRTRPCPKCGKLGMYNATVCGYCWTKTPFQASTPTSEPVA
jgi:hypothetical protein